ncbi:MAG: cyanophycin synthetase, partial [Sphingobacteriales bacterium]
VMAATLATFLWGFKTEDIRISLETFIPSAAQTPGRMNIFDFKEFRFMIDFAHNPDGYNGVREFLSHVESPQKIGLIAGTGDRRDDDLRELGRIAAAMFDHIVLRQENHMRGRTRENILDLMIEGIKEIKPDMSYEIITFDNTKSIEYLIGLAKPGAFVTNLNDAVDGAIDIVQSFREKERDVTP